MKKKLKDWHKEHINFVAGDGKTIKCAYQIGMIDYLINEK